MREYCAADAAATLDVFSRAVLEMAAGDYPVEQREAWAANAGTQCLGSGAVGDALRSRRRRVGAADGGHCFGRGSRHPCTHRRREYDRESAIRASQLHRRARADGYPARCRIHELSHGAIVDRGAELIAIITRSGSLRRDTGRPVAPAREHESRRGSVAPRRCSDRPGHRAASPRTVCRGRSGRHHHSPS